MPNNVKYAYYSAKMARLMGNQVYKNAQGEEIICTSVYPSRKHSLSWDDVEYKGPVVEFVRVDPPPQIDRIEDDKRTPLKIKTNHPAYSQGLPRRGTRPATPPPPKPTDAGFFGDDDE